MITAKRLRELLEQVPDEAGLIAYEGEGVGLCVLFGESSGWIETGDSEDCCEDDSNQHDLVQFRKEITQ